ncbi:MAG: OmpA family protein [Planctomycetes bacterium]|nr:OmpA family protein [Planctomycetota bacterium]
MVKVEYNMVEGPLDGAPGWVATFVDMISLLVTFFILLFTFASMEDYDTFSYPKNILGTRGVLKKDGGQYISAPDDDIMSATDMLRGADTPHSRPSDQLPESMEEMGQKLTDEHIEFDARDVQDGMRMRFDPRAGFAPGSATVNPVLRKALVEMGQTLQHYQHLIVVEGYTDDSFIPTSAMPSAEAMGLARAQAAAKVLLAHSTLSPKAIQLAGMGNVPLEDHQGKTALDRAANRRVEIRILSMDEQRAKILLEETR